MEIPHYNHKLKERAGDMRKNSTYSEIILWNAIKQRQIEGYQFLRKKSLEIILWIFIVEN